MLLCLIVFVVSVLYPFPVLSESIGFPTLANENDLRAALEAIRKEDDIPGSTTSFSVDYIYNCIMRTQRCGLFEDLYKKETQLRTGYKTLGENCSSDPELNADLFSPPQIFNAGLYFNWQRRLLATNKSLCNPLKHLRCSKISGKCECRQGLTWVNETFESSEGIPQPLRLRRKICVIPMEKMCQMREPSEKLFVDDVFNTNTDTNENEKKGRTGMPVIFYCNIFDLGVVNGGLKLEPPNCGPGECSRSHYTQRQRVCAPRNWDKEMSNLEKYFDELPRMPPGKNCSLEGHNRLNTFSIEEQTPHGFLNKRKKNLQDLEKSGAKHFCDTYGFATCGSHSGKCECIFPASEMTSHRIKSCVIPEDQSRCEYSREISSIIQNNTLAYWTRLQLARGLQNQLSSTQHKTMDQKQSCPHNFSCHVGEDIDQNMEIYCTCPNAVSGSTCEEKLTKFLTFVRIPSFASDAKTIRGKRKIFNALNHMALEFEDIFKLEEDDPCNFTVNTEAQMTIELLQSLDKKGTAMTKLDYKNLTDSMEKLTNELNETLGQRLCLRFDDQPLTCNLKSGKCVTEDLNNIIQKCNFLPDVCEDKIEVVNGSCVCGNTTFPTLLKQNSTSPPSISKNRQYLTLAVNSLVCAIVLYLY